MPLSWVTSKKVRAKLQPCLSAFSASRGALWLLSMSEAWSYQRFWYQCPNRQRSTYLSLQYLAEVDMGITGCLGPQRWPRRSEFLSTLSLLVLLNLALLWVFICSAWSAYSPDIPNLLLSLQSISSDYSVGLVSKTGFIDKLGLVTFKLLTTDLLDHQISVQEAPSLELRRNMKLISLSDLFLWTPLMQLSISHQLISLPCLSLLFCLRDALKVSSGIPYIIETKVREVFNSQGKQFPYSCCHLALVKRFQEPVTDLQLWQIHTPLWMQGTQSLIQSLCTQGLFHNRTSTKHFLTSLLSNP